MNSRMVLGVALAGPFFLIALLVLVVLSVVLDEEEAAALSCPPGASASPGSATVSGNLPSVPGWTAEQVRNAAHIVAAGEELGVSLRGQTIAVMTAIGESSLRVLDHGDDAGPDSRGLFQQRDNGAWGTYEDRMDPRRSAISFYQALLKVEDWQNLEPTLAAHKTQHNADPYYYAPKWDSAIKLVAAVSDVPADSLNIISTGGLAECDALTLTAAGTITWPLPPSLAKSSDRHNFGDGGPRWSHGHTGTDFSVPCGTAVYAAHNGTIEIDTSQSWSGPWLVKVTTGEDTLATWYAHMQRVRVKPGQTVTAGQQIGDVGTEGNSTGCHLHFEVHPKNGGIYEDGVNPSTWLRKNVGKNLGGGQTGQLGPGWRVASFNALGHSHTKPGGNRPGWDSAVERTRRAAALFSAYDLDVIGLQEWQTPQGREFLRIAGSQWAMFPDPGGKQPDNAVAWRKDNFKKIRTRRVSIPYFHGHHRSMPAVLLEERATGKRYWVISVHNPANARGPAQHWRDAAVRRERAFVRSLRASGHPVILTGDMNERGRAFCGLTRGGLMVSASGGSNAGRCITPPKMEIDWIFGSGVVFTGYQVDARGKGTISDHPLVMASVG